MSKDKLKDHKQKAYEQLNKRPAPLNEQSPVEVVEDDAFERMKAGAPSTPPAAVVPAPVPEPAPGLSLYTRTPDPAKPWEGKRTLDASPRLQRCKFTEEQLSERRIELIKMHARTPMLQDEHAAAAELATQKKDQLKGHLAAIGGHAATTVAGWESREVDTVEVEERRPSLGMCAVRYRCDTGEEIGIRELRADELQSTIPGS